jgi:Galactosyltransferase/Glycosyl transferase family 11
MINKYIVTMTPDFLFVIYTCQPNLPKAHVMYDRFSHLLAQYFNMKMLITYGDMDLIKKDPYLLLNDKYLVLNIDDGYESLDKKSLALFKAVSQLFPEIKGCFKCDDDVLVNIESLYQFIEMIKHGSIDYSGLTIMKRETEDAIKHLAEKNMTTTKTIKTPNAVYCGGPLYYLSQRSLQVVNDAVYEQVDSIFYEDLMIGYILNQEAIFPVRSNLYTDSISHFNVPCSYHNRHHRNILFVRIRGGIGNQLFQVAAGQAIAQKNNMDCIILNSSNVLKQEFTHTTDNNMFVNTIFKAFPHIRLELIQLIGVTTYKESANNCFVYHDVVLPSTTYTDILLDGYFQNEKQFKAIKPQLIKSFKGNEVYKKCLTDIFVNKEYASFVQKSYFIHLRRGDYIGHPIHQIDLDSYFVNAIKYIKKKETSPHFFIISDDIEFCKTFGPKRI